LRAHAKVLQSVFEVVFYIAGGRPLRDRNHIQNEFTEAGGLKPVRALRPNEVLRAEWERAPPMKL
jgi:hypothetical protein